MHLLVPLAVKFKLSYLRLLACISLRNFLKINEYIMKLLREIRFRAKVEMGCGPWGFFLFRYVKAHSHRLSTKGATICIEGYPRCANSYFLNRFVAAYPNFVKIAHHVHVSGQVHAALQMRIPTIVLIREPVECITSLYLAEGGEVSMGCLIDYYIKFYKSCLKADTQSVVWVGFDTATKDPRQVILRMNDTYGLNLDVAAIESIGDDDLFDKLKRHNSVLGQAEGFVAVPDENRKKLKDQSRSLCLSHPKMATANALYAKIMQNFAI